MDQYWLTHCNKCTILVYEANKRWNCVQGWGGVERGIEELHTFQNTALKYKDCSLWIVTAEPSDNPIILKFYFCYSYCKWHIPHIRKSLIICINMFINVLITKLYLHFTKIFWVCKDHSSSSAELCEATCSTCYYNWSWKSSPFSLAFDEAGRGNVRLLEGR